MFFWLSKILWIFVNPGNLLLLGILVGTVLLFTRWFRAARTVFTFLATTSLIIAIFPIGGWMISLLENRFPPPHIAMGEVEGIVALGGIVDQVLTQERGQLALGSGYQRLTELSRLAALYPNAKIVFSGGSGDILNQKIKEADVLVPYLNQLGLSPQRLILENRSRNTYENAIFSRTLVDPQPGERWVIITSAFHMPRTMGTFQQAGWHGLIAYPVNYRYGPSGPRWPRFNLIFGLKELDTAIHEWLGLLAYRLVGRSSALFPSS
jgi:uncharacterized SAM-binding protein YcdF (DUF218 family)